MCIALFFNWVLIYANAIQFTLKSSADASTPGRLERHAESDEFLFIMLLWVFIMVLRICNAIEICE